MSYFNPVLETARQEFQSLQASKNIVEGILSSPELDLLVERYRLEGAHNHPHGDDHGHHHDHDHHHNPLEKIREDIAKHGARFEKNPELLVFMKELVKIERRAMGANSAEEAALKSQLQGLEDFLSLEEKSLSDRVLAPVPRLKDLPDDYKRVLGMVRHHTAQNKWGPVRSMRNILKETGEHVWEEVKEKPVASAGLATLGAAGAWFMNANLDSTATIYVDPEMMTTTNFSLDALSDPNYVPVSNADFVPTSIDLACHNHIVQILDDFVGQNAAESLAQKPVIQMFFPNHCNKVKTLLPEAQNILQNGYDWWNARIAPFMADPTAVLSEKAIPPSAFKQAFDTAAYQTAELWYAANTYENFVFHTLVAFAGTVGVYKMGSLLADEETSHHLQEIKDFGKRSWANSKLSYLFSAAGVALPAIVEQGWTPMMVWGGLAGLAAGEMSHRIGRAWNRAKFAKQTTLGVQKDLAHFANPSAITAGGYSASDVEKTGWAQRLLSRRKNAITTGFVLSAVSALDIAFNEAVLTGYTLGTITPTGLFLGFNAVEDTAAHIIFGIAGGTLGGAALVTTVGGKKVIDLAKNEVEILDEGLKKITEDSGFESKADLAYALAGGLIGYNGKYLRDGVHQSLEGPKQGLKLARLEVNAVVQKSAEWLNNKTVKPVKDKFSQARTSLRNAVSIKPEILTLNFAEIQDYAGRMPKDPVDCFFKEATECDALEIRM